jgi:hypothetical protein
MNSSPFPCYHVLLSPNIPLSTLFSNTISLRSSLKVSDHVSHPYKTKRKIITLYILIFLFFDRKQDGKKILHRMIASIPWFQSALISSWMEFSFVSVVPKYFVPPFQRIYSFSSYCDFVLHSDFNTWTCTSLTILYQKTGSIVGE